MSRVSIAVQVNAERLMLLSWGRAILLQLAHPLVAAGVADHSSFRQGKLTAVVRLHETIHAMLSLTFGSDAERNATFGRINDIHRRVNGTLREDAGMYPAGTAYSAEDPKLLLWVYGTLLDSALLVYERLIQPLSDRERDLYCEEAVPVIRGLGVAGGEPRSWDELGRYMTGMYASGEIAVSGQARELAAALLRPPLGWAVGPASRVNRLFTVGLLPPRIREQYSLPWTARDQRALDRWTTFLRAARPWLPRRVAVWREARAALGS